MTDRLTRWEGRDENGPRAVLSKEGRFPDILQEALRKLAEYEDLENYVDDQLSGDTWPSVKDMHDRAEAEWQRSVLAQYDGKEEPSFSRISGNTMDERKLEECIQEICKYLEGETQK